MATFWKMFLICKSYYDFQVSLCKWNQSLLLTCPPKTSNFTLGMWVGTSSAGLWSRPFSKSRQEEYSKDWISRETISVGSSLTSAHGQLYKSCEFQLLPPHASLTYAFTCWTESGRSLHITYRKQSLVPFYHNQAYIIKCKFKAHNLCLCVGYSSCLLINRTWWLQQLQ